MAFDLFASNNIFSFVMMLFGMMLLISNIFILPAVIGKNPSGCPPEKLRQIRMSTYAVVVAAFAISVYFFLAQPLPTDFLKTEQL